MDPIVYATISAISLSAGVKLVALGKAEAFGHYSYGQSVYRGNYHIPIHVNDSGRAEALISTEHLAKAFEGVKIKDRGEVNLDMYSTYTEALMTRDKVLGSVITTVNKKAKAPLDGRPVHKMMDGMIRNLWAKTESHYPLRPKGEFKSTVEISVYKNYLLPRAFNAKAVKLGCAGIAAGALFLVPFLFTPKDPR